MTKGLIMIKKSIFALVICTNILFAQNEVSGSLGFSLGQMSISDNFHNTKDNDKISSLNKKGNNLNKLDLKIKNYFNTYRYRGLPPTPICYPGEKAILAVLYPNYTDYLYFVSDGKGGHRFSKNFSEHKKNIKLWIKDLKNYGKN